MVALKALHSYEFSEMFSVIVSEPDHDEGGGGGVPCCVKEKILSLFIAQKRKDKHIK